MTISDLLSYTIEISNGIFYDTGLCEINSYGNPYHYYRFTNNNNDGFVLSYIEFHLIINGLAIRSTRKEL